MKILHTGDWHLGATLEGQSRDEEHRRFLEWLLETLRTRSIEVLLVAGDVFHYAQPSAEAQRLYYAFLARLQRETAVRHTVIVGGNHDSPSRLNAPISILESLQITVVGGLSNDRSKWERCVCPIEDGEGRVQLVVLAVPFVHEFRLGVRTTQRSAREVREQFRECFGEVYGLLADVAESRYPGVPIVGMGHLACAGESPEHWGVEIHQLATIGGLPKEIFDPRMQYVALGHIHEMYPVDGSRAWYCGSPVALNRLESRSERYVLEVELGQGSEPLIAPISVPCDREILELGGSVDTCLEKIGKASSDAPLPPFLFVEAEVDRFVPDLPRTFLEQLAARKEPEHLRPKLLRVTQTRLTSEENVSEDGREVGPSLRELSPEDVFLRLYRMQHEEEPPRDDLLNAFRSILSTLHRAERESLEVSLEASSHRAGEP